MNDPYANAKYDRRYNGTILIDGVEVAVTRQCVHCGGHFTSIRGSGVTRGWCINCNGVVCGPQCSSCVPFERQLELMEGADPTKIIVPTRG